MEANFDVIDKHMPTTPVHKRQKAMLVAAHPVDSMPSSLKVPLRIMCEAEIYIYRVLQTIQMKLILLCRAGRFGQC